MFAGGVEPASLVLPWEDAYVICADSGYRLCRRWGHRPDVVLGDLDSLGSAELGEIEQLGIDLEVHPAEKDESDLELALRWAHSRGVREVWIAGAVGGRLDHCLFNLIAVLGLADELGMEAVAVSSQGEFRVVSRELRLENRKGWLCSLLPLNEHVSGVSLEGFRFPLKGETLLQTRTRSLSNVVEENPAMIRVHRGRLLAMLVEEDSACSNA